MDKKKDLEELEKKISSCRRCFLYNRFAKSPFSQNGDEGKARFQASPQNGGKAVESLRKKAPHFQCGEAYKTATQAVPGEGNPNAKIMFIGEAPGFFEDKQGKPFVGQAGKLLDKLLSAKGGSASGGQLINLSRKNIFITNLVKHRPSGNRDPLPAEIEACKIWLDKQIEIINPEIIVTLGRFSMAKFIPEEKISHIHGKKFVVEFKERRTVVIPMYHPAAGLRNAKIMEEMKEDFLNLENEIS